jgi:signal transduction histidine kinase
MSATSLHDHREQGQTAKCAALPAQSRGCAVPAARERLTALLSGRLDTTSAGVELALVRAFTGLRAINLTQLWLAQSALLLVGPRPALNATLVLLFTIWSLALVTIALRMRRITDPRLVAADIVVAMICLLAAPLITTASTHINTWHAWPHPVTLSTALLLGAALRPRLAAAGTALLAVTYLATTLPQVDGPGQKWTVLTNAVAYIAFTLIGGALAGYLRRLGHDADTERERAAHLGARVGAEAEMERHRRLLHDHAALLYFIGNGNTADDPTLEASLRRQAIDGANRVNAFLSSTATTTRPSGTTLAEVAQHAASLFPDLPLTVNADLATTYQLPPALVDVVDGAVTTLLHNVRTHAAATSCTVHAVGAGTWFEVTVRDDGIGYEPATTATGFGLSRQVRGACAAHGIDVAVHSAPGEGTTVTLSHGLPSPGQPAQTEPAQTEHARDRFDPGLSRSGEDR